MTQEKLSHPCLLGLPVTPPSAQAWPPPPPPLLLLLLGSRAQTLLSAQRFQPRQLVPAWQGRHNCLPLLLAS
jgi:hypothetical protein